MMLSCTSARKSLQFQCSSASRKFLDNGRRKLNICVTVACFSALQRAENSSMVLFERLAHINLEFQCSSASRKFLNLTICCWCAMSGWFQCSSASRKFLNQRVVRQIGEHERSFQCSSASRKFLNTSVTSQRPIPAGVSVLFSEPKIPQFSGRNTIRRAGV